LAASPIRSLEPPAIAELKRMYVRPAARGRGLGRALATAALEAASQLVTRSSGWTLWPRWWRPVRCIAPSGLWRSGRTGTIPCRLPAFTSWRSARQARPDARILRCTWPFHRTFRWALVVLWILGTFVAVRALPSLGSVVNNNNSAFLPANAPDVKAANLAAPLVGKESLEPIVIVAVAHSGVLTTADISAIETEARLVRDVANVKIVQFVGISADHKAIQLAAARRHRRVQPAQGGGRRGRGDGDVSESARAQWARLLRGWPGIGLGLPEQAIQLHGQQDAGSLRRVHPPAPAPDLPVRAGAVGHLLPAFVVLQLSGSIIGELGAHAGLQVHRYPSCCSS